MGVKLSELVPKDEVTWEQLKGKKIAIDASNALYQFVSSIRQRDGTPLMDSKGNVTSHLVGIFSRFSNLMAKGLKLCVVFDGKPPELKHLELAKRKQRKEEAQKKYEKAVEEGEEEQMLKYSRQVSKLSMGMIDEAKELISAMGLPVVQAPSEAEVQAALMCRNKDVWAVASSDYDCLLFRAPRMLTNLTLSQKRRLPSGQTAMVYPQLIELKDVLNKLAIEIDQLTALAMLVGTDFNPGGVKGIGPKKALTLVQTDKRFEEIFEDVEFDWKEIIGVFKNMPVDRDYVLEWKEPDEERIKKILVGKHDFSEERVDNTLAKLRTRDKGQVGLGKWM